MPLWLRTIASTCSRWPGSTPWCRVSPLAGSPSRRRSTIVAPSGFSAAAGICGCGTAPCTSVLGIAGIGAGGWAGGGGAAFTGEVERGGAGGGGGGGAACPLPASGGAGVVGGGPAAGPVPGPGGGGVAGGRRGGLSGLRRRGLGLRLGGHLGRDRLHEARRLPAQVLAAAAEVLVGRVLLAAALARPHVSTFFFAAFTRRRYVVCTGLYCSMHRAMAACVVSSMGLSQ